MSRETGADVFLKLEGCNPTGSFKDRGMVAVARAVEEKARAAICASTGNTAASAAAYAARAGLPCAVVIPAGKIALGKLSQAIIHHARVLPIEGNFDAALKLVRELAEQGSITLVNSVNQYRIEGQKTGAFDDVDARARLSALFPDLKFTPEADAFRVNADPNWAMWITLRAEGRFTQDDTPELAAIIVNDAPRLSPEHAQRYAPAGSFLAIFQRRDGKLSAVQRALLFPTALLPPAFDARIERATDFDHDGRDELLIVTLSETLGVATAAAFLYLWDDQAFVVVWSASTAEDNTSALNQPEYFATESEIRFADLDGDGWDEIVVDGVRIAYARDAQGLADLDRETRRRAYRHAYRWNGAAFVLDPARATPLPK